MYLMTCDIWESTFTNLLELLIVLHDLDEYQLCFRYWLSKSAFSFHGGRCMRGSILLHRWEWSLKILPSPCWSSNCCCCEIQTRNWTVCWRCWRLLLVVPQRQSKVNRLLCRDNTSDNASGLGFSLSEGVTTYEGITIFCSVQSTSLLHHLHSFATFSWSPGRQCERHLTGIHSLLEILCRDEASILVRKFYVIVAAPCFRHNLSMLMRRRRSHWKRYSRSIRRSKSLILTATRTS